jgi:hypothetical protein
MITENKSAKKEIKDPVFAVRERTAGLLTEIFQFVPPSVVGPLLGVAGRTAYRWTDDELTPPPPEKVAEVMALYERVEKVKTFWAHFLEGWTSSPPDVAPMFFFETIVFLNSKLTSQEKLKRLVKQTFINVAALENEKKAEADEGD